MGQDCNWPAALQLRLLGLLAGCAETSRQSPVIRTGHLLLGGLFAQFEALEPDLNEALAHGPPQWAMLWARDKGVLDIGAGARAKRLANALAEQ